MLTLDYLHHLKETHQAALKVSVSEFAIGNQWFHFNTQPVIMGVVNLSSESWYRESVCLNAEMAIQRSRVLRAQGADIIDIGAESTLAYAQRIESSNQNSQLLPVLAALKNEGILTSVETYYPTVVDACLKAGANLINLTGTDHHSEIYRQIAEYDAGVIICYVQGKNVREVENFDWGLDPIDLMYDYFAREIELATQLGVQKIFIDAGLGFYYKNLQDSAVRIRFQMQSFLNSFRLRRLGFPVCNALPHAFEYFGEEVRSAEAFFAILAALGKTDLFRTHEVPKIKAVLNTMAVFEQN